MICYGNYVLICNRKLIVDLLVCRIVSRIWEKLINILWRFMGELSMAKEVVDKEPMERIRTQIYDIIKGLIVDAIAIKISLLGFISSLLISKFLLKMVILGVGEGLRFLCIFPSTKNITRRWLSREVSWWAWEKVRN